MKYRIADVKTVLEKNYLLTTKQKEKRIIMFG